jgi:hypothetical protein
MVVAPMTFDAIFTVIAVAPWADVQTAPPRRPLARAS